MSEIGSKFKNLCFVGLNKIEYFPETSDESIFADSWKDVVDEHSRQKMGLFFFAPRDLDGEPVDPYDFLATADGNEDEQEIAMAHNILGKMPLVDMCRMKTPNANSLNILVVADIIFHWDVNDSYIQPTTPISWERDIKQIVKGYPRSTEKHIYTNWNSFKLDGLGVDIHPVQELFLDEGSWLNKPTYQQKYGSQMLVFSLMIAAIVYGGLYIQAQEIESLSTQIREVTTSTPKGKNYKQISRSIREQKAFMHYRSLMPFITKDIANAIQLSGMKIADFRIEAHDAQKPPKNMLVTIRAQQGIYNGWLEEEPIAKALLGQSVALEAIRRPPGGNFSLEGTVNLERLYKSIEKFNSQKNNPQQKSSKSSKAVKSVEPTDKTTKAKNKHGGKSS